MLHGMQDLSSQPEIKPVPPAGDHGDLITGQPGDFLPLSLKTKNVWPQTTGVTKSWTWLRDWTELNFPLSNDPISLLPLILKFTEREILHIIVIYF